MTATLPGVETRFADLPGLRMHYAEAGPADGVPIALFHGFPEFWYSWRFQITALAEAGYRVIAPDQRGYNLTEKRGPYDVENLTQDILHLADALDIERWHIVGHDWGGPPTWAFAARHPERMRKLVTMNAPHPGAYRDALGHYPRQLLKSWYMGFFQIPELPEILLRANGYAAIRRAFSEIPPDRMTLDDVQCYIDAYEQPGALKAMINWYRALPKQMLSTDTFGRGDHVTVPTCVIWGERDAYLEKGTTDTLHNYVDDIKIHFLPEVSHWVQMHAPDEVNKIMLEFLAD